MWALNSLFSSVAMEPVHSFSQVECGPKSQTFSGRRKPFLAAVTTMPVAISPPTRAGNSSPIKKAVAT